MASSGKTINALRSTIIVQQVLTSVEDHALLSNPAVMVEYGTQLCFNVYVLVAHFGMEIVVFNVLVDKITKSIVVVSVHKEPSLNLAPVKLFP